MTHRTLVFERGFVTYLLTVGPGMAWRESTLTGFWLPIGFAGIPLLSVMGRGRVRVWCVWAPGWPFEPFRGVHEIPGRPSGWVLTALSL